MHARNTNYYDYFFTQNFNGKFIAIDRETARQVATTNKNTVREK